MTRKRLANRRESEVCSFVCDGQMYRVTGSRFSDGQLAEVFLDCSKPDSALQTQAETAAILTSIALQHGVSVKSIRHSITGPIAVALDLLEGAA